MGGEAGPIGKPRSSRRDAARREPRGRGHSLATQDEISGAYVHEYSFKVVNPETGTEIGLRTVRDTIFIRLAAVNFELSNRKWAKNDYDNRGWMRYSRSCNY